jgi:hypothetical protein
VVAERHYLGVVLNVSPDARTLEDAMGIASKLRDALGLTKGEAEARALG